MNIISGGLGAFDALVYGEQNPVNQGYFARSLEQFPALQTVSDVGRHFIDSAKAAYEAFNGSEAMQLIRAATRQAVALFQPEIIKSIFDIADFQTASLTMQRWVMANPVVRQSYFDQRCEGYADTYTDVDPGKIRDEHYDYRRVMHGVVQLEDDSWQAKFYMENLRTGDRDLTTADKVDILQTWKMVEMFIKAGESDPTSPYNSML